MSDEINRRHFMGAAAMTIAAAKLGIPASALPLAGTSGRATASTVSPGTHTSFGLLKQINAGLLNVGYAEAGPATSPAVVLMHGWPYDTHSYVDVAPLLAAKALVAAMLLAAAASCPLPLEASSNEARSVVHRRGRRRDRHASA
jgi:hypothetical protein